jgi:hypothetical protein
MATKGNMTLRIEPELKKEAAALFQSLGLDLSTLRVFSIVRHCVIMVCRLRFVWMSRTPRRERLLMRSRE